jgi:protein PhnA
MARRKVKQRPAVGILGKLLTRRSRGRCELCEGREGVRPWEIPPFPDEPDPERTLMACARCRAWLEAGVAQGIEAQVLAQSVWSEEPAVRLASARLLLASDFAEDPWIRDALDAAGVDPSTGEFAAP